MTSAIKRLSLPAAMAGLVLLVVTGCVASGGYGYEGADFGPGYYEPYGGDYGGWGDGYRVGPMRGRGGYRGGQGGSHAYRAAPRSGSMPSIPSQGRSGGFGHAGGGGRR